MSDISSLLFNLNARNAYINDYNNTNVSAQLAIAFMLTLTITIYNYSLSVTLETAKDQSSFTRKYANEIANIVTGLISSTVILVLSFVSHTFIYFIEST